MYVITGGDCRCKGGGRSRWRIWHSHPVEYKEDFNPVTEIDKACDRAITRMILDAFPDHNVLTEESPFEEKGSQWKWIVDPLDGTTNYYHGFPFFAVSIGLEVEREVKLGVVYHPALNELFHAEKGEGAYLNGNRIFVSRVNDLNEGFLCTGFPYDSGPCRFYLNYFRQFIAGACHSKAGSAAIDCARCGGKFDGFWELRPSWDGPRKPVDYLKRRKGDRFSGQPPSIYSKRFASTD
jgi:myo-inositol-1(or 4)-monophosphatase